MEKIRVGIVGYGNVGRGVELAVSENSDTVLAAVFTRRDPGKLEIATKTAKVVHIDDILGYRDKIDVLILCGGSATDLPEQGPPLAAHFNTIDSFDTHAKIPAYFNAMDAAAKSTVSVISVGWDPGLFSMQRLLAAAALPQGRNYTFWGHGVSQGHSDAVRQVDGVRDAIQYTVPIDRAMEAVRSGSAPALRAGDRHLRECYVVAEPGADKAQIEQSIKTMPDYFDEYETIVHFISQEELNQNHSSMPHGGFVIRNGKTGESGHVMEFSIKLESNPEFTASILVAYARAAVRMAREGISGAKTVFDVPLSYLSPMDRVEQMHKFL